MLVANYFSTIAGYLAIDTLVSRFGLQVFADIPYNLQFVSFVLFAIAFALSVLLEWPFIIQIFAGRRHQVSTKSNSGMEDAIDLCM